MLSELYCCFHLHLIRLSPDLHLITQIYNHLFDNQHQSRQHNMPTLAQVFPDFVNCSRGDFWSFRIFMMVMAVFSAIIPAVVLTWIVDSKFHVTQYNKYQELPWEVHVANITLDVRRNSDSPMQCKGHAHIFALI